MRRVLATAICLLMACSVNAQAVADPQHLAALLGHDATTQSRYAALQAFHQLMAMGPAAAPATPELAALLFHRNKLVGKSAARVLASIGPEAGAAIPDLYGALQNRDLMTDASKAIVCIRVGCDHTAVK